MEKVTHSRLRVYGFALSLGMSLTAWVLWSRGAGLWVILPMVIGSPALILALFRPGLLLSPYKASRSWGNLFGNILAWVLMTPLYFLLFTPLALILRFFGSDHIGKHGKDPLWKPVPERDNSARQMEKLW